MSDLSTQALERANTEIDKYISRRSEDRKRANTAAAEEADILRRRQKAERAENRALWYAHYIRMADSHAEISADYLRRAHELYPGDLDG